MLWPAEDGVTSLTLELAEPALITAVGVLNTHNGVLDDRCTADFKLEFSTDGAAWPAKTMVEGTLRNRLGGKQRIDKLIAELEQAREAEQPDDEVRQTTCPRIPAPCSGATAYQHPDPLRPATPAPRRSTGLSRT